MHLQFSKNHSAASSNVKDQLGILPGDPALDWLRQGVRRDHNQFVAERLDELARDAGEFGLTRQETMQAILQWAAKRLQAEGGYAHTKAAMLEAIEAILLSAARCRPE